MSWLTRLGWFILLTLIPIAVAASSPASTVDSLAPAKVIESIEVPENARLRSTTALGAPLIHTLPGVAEKQFNNDPDLRDARDICFHLIDDLTDGCDSDTFHDQGEVLIYDVAILNNSGSSTGEFYADIQVKAGSDPNGYVTILTSTATFPDLANGQYGYASIPFTVEYSGPIASTYGDPIQLEVVNILGTGWTSTCTSAAVTTYANLDDRGTPYSISYHFDSPGTIGLWSNELSHGTTSFECSGTWNNGSWVQSDVRYVNDDNHGYTCDHLTEDCGSAHISHDGLDNSDVGLLSPEVNFSTYLYSKVRFWWWASLDTWVYDGTGYAQEGFIVEGSNDYVDTNNATWQQMEITPDYNASPEGTCGSYYGMPFPNYQNNGPTPILFGDGNGGAVTGDIFSSETVADFTSFRQETTVRIRFRNSADTYAYGGIEGIYIDEVQLVSTEEAEPSVCSPSPDLQYGDSSAFDDSTYCSDDGYLDPGDTGILQLYIDNLGNDVATNVTATLACSSCPVGVTLCDSTATYGTVPFGTSLLWGASSDTFSIAVDAAVACNNAVLPYQPTAVDLDLTLSADSYGPVIRSTTITLGRESETARYEDHFMQAPDGTLSSGRTGFSSPGWTEIAPIYVAYVASPDSDGQIGSAQIKGTATYDNGIYRTFPSTGVTYNLTLTWDWHLDQLHNLKTVYAQFTTDGSTWTTIRSMAGQQGVNPGWISYSVDLVSEFGATLLDNANFGLKFYHDGNLVGHLAYIDNMTIVGTTHECVLSPCKGNCPDGCDEPIGLAITFAEDQNECLDTGVLIQWTTPSDWGDGVVGSRSIALYRYDDALCTVGEFEVVSGLGEATSQYVDSASPNNTDYYYKVAATNRCGKTASDCYGTSARDNFSTAPTWSGISDVADLDDCEGTGVRITWSAIAAQDWNDAGFGSGSQHFELYRYTDGGCSANETLIDAGILSSATYYDYDAPDNTAYYYKVIAVNRCDLETSSCSAVLTDYASAIPDVQNPAVADDDDCLGNGVTISWDLVADWKDNDLGPGSRYFDLYRYTNAACSEGETYLTPAHLIATTVSYQDDPADNTAFYYKLLATNKCSDVFSICPLSVTDYASSDPTGLTVSVVDDDDCIGDGVTISWTTPSWNDNDQGGGTRTFDIYRYTDAGCTADQTVVASSLGEGVTEQAYNPPDNIDYYYQAVATNLCGDTASDCFTALSDKASASPTWAGVTSILDDTDCTGDGITFTWPAPSDWEDNDVTVSGRHFEIHRYTNSGCTEGEVVINANIASDQIGYSYDPPDNVIYYHKVTAVNGCNDSTSSCDSGGEADYQSASPTWTGISTVTDNDLCVGDGITVSWATPSDWGDNSVGAGSRTFDLYRYTDSGCSAGQVVVTTGLAEGVTSYALHDPPDNTVYYYQVVATNNCSDTTSSCDAGGTTDYQSASPTWTGISSVTDNDLCVGDGITISWATPSDWGDNSVGPDSRTFAIYRYTDSGCTAGQVVVQTGIVFDQTGYLYNPPDNVTYYYKVTAVNACGDSTSSCDSGGVIDYHSVSPTWTGISSVTDNDLCNGDGITFSWATPSEWGDNGLGAGSRTFDIYRYTDSGCSAGEVVVQTGIASDQTGYLYNPPDNITYYYKVTAVNACGDSTPSCDSGGEADYHSTSPTWTGITSVTDNKLCVGDGITVRWATPSDWGDNGMGAGSRIFDIYRYTDSGCSAGQVVVAAGLTEGVIIYNLHDPPDNTVYYYQVVATNNCGDASSSCDSSGTTDYQPSNPSGLNVMVSDAEECSGSGISISWTLTDWGDNDVGSGTRSFDIYRYDNLGCSANEFSVVTGLGEGVSNYSYDPPDNTNYHYRVVAKNKCSRITGVCSAGITDYATTTPTWAGVSGIVDLDDCLGSGVRISWPVPSDWGDNDLGGGSRHFEIYRYDDAGCSVNQAVVNLNVSEGSLFYDYDAPDNTTYYYRVAAINACGGSTVSCYATGVIDYGSSSPTWTGVSGVLDPDECTGDGVQISWSALGGSDWNDNSLGGGTRHFEVYRHSVAGCGDAGTLVNANVAFDSTGITDDPADNTTYYYRVIAVNSCGDTNASCSAAISDLATYTPVGLSASASDADTCDDTGVQISWTGPSDWGDHGNGTTHYELYRYEGTGCSAGELLLSADVTSPYVDLTGTNNTTYSYKVVAVNGCGTSSESCTAGVADEVSSAPVGLSITSAIDIDGCADTGVSISWAAPSDWGDHGFGTPHYEVYRYTEVACGGTATLMSADASSPLVDLTGTNGVDYYYKGVAVNGCGDSSEACSAAVSDTTASPPDAPVITDLADIDPLIESGVQITWTHSGNWGDDQVAVIDRTFSIYRYTGAGCSSLDGTVATGLPSGTTTHTDMGGLANEEYYYQVVAVNSCSQTGTSTCEGPMGDWVELGGVENVHWTDKDTLTWDIVVKAKTYHVYRGIKSTLIYLLDANIDSCLYATPAINLQAGLTDVRPVGDFYWFLITAVNPGGQGGTPGFGRILNEEASCPGTFE